VTPISTWGSKPAEDHPSTWDPEHMSGMDAGDELLVGQEIIGSRNGLGWKVLQ